MATKTAVEDTTKTVGAGKAGDLCVVDTGKHRRKQVRRLRRGDGKRTTKAEEIIHDLKDRGVLAKDANTVVFVVRQKSGGMRSLLG